MGQRMGQRPGREWFGVTFTEVLHDLIGLNGSTVTVAVGAREGRPSAAMLCTGTLSCAVDVLGTGPCDHEVLYFSLEEDGATGFVIERQGFEGACWHGEALHVEFGPLTLTIQPT